MTDDEGPGALEEKERIVGHQVRLTGAMVIATVIVLMSALLAFITVPPQPTFLLLLGVFVAVVIYWVARTTGGTPFPRGGPHEERVAACANCGLQYCPGCQETLPGVRIRSHPARFLIGEHRAASVRGPSMR